MRPPLAFAALMLVGAAVLLAQNEETEPTTPVSRIVRVLRVPDGTPVEGASVEAWGAPGGTVVRRTGADGTARFGGVPRNDVVFVARLPGFRCGWHEPGRWWWSVPEEDGDPDGDGVTRMTLALVPGTVVEGRVQTKKGRPIEGAVIEARVVAHATDLWTLRGAPLWTATTDEEGRFRTSEHWPKLDGEDHKLVSAIVTARGPGWIHEKTEVWPGDAGKQEPLTFRLLPAGEIHGVVTGGDAKPAAGALVLAYPPDFWAFAPDERNDRDTSETHPREMHVRADERGGYSLSEAFPGVKYRIFAEVEAPEPDREYGAVVARSAVSEGTGVGAAGEKVALDLRVRRLGSLTVRFAPDAGVSAKGSHIELLPPRDARPWVYEDEEDGVVTVAEADPGEWTIEADAYGWLPHRSAVTLGEGEAKTVVIRLDRGAAVEGLVVDDAGKPVPDARVYAYSVDPENPERHLDGREEARTGEDGRFRLAGLRPGPTDLSVGHERLRSDGHVRVDAPATDVVLVLHALASLRFKLRLAPGAEAPKRVRVTITRLDGPNKGTQGQYVVSMKDDAYAVDDLLPGPVSFAVEAKGYAPFVTRLTIEPGAVNEPEPFEPSEGITLRGRVVDGAGKGIRGARILAWGNEENAVVTDEDGAFAIPHMAPGRVDLSVTAEGMAEVQLTPRIADAMPPLTITVRPGGLVRGTIRDEEGRELASLDIFPAAAKDDNVSRWRVEVRDGAFSVRLPAGKYRCAYRLAGAKRGPAVFEVREGGEVVLDLVYP